MSGNATLAGRASTSGPHATHEAEACRVSRVPGTCLSLATSSRGAPAPPGCILLEATAHDGLELGCHAVQLRPIGLREQDLCQNVALGARCERLAPGQRLEQTASEAPDVRTLARLTTSRLLGAHVGHGSEKSAVERSLVQIATALGLRRSVGQDRLRESEVHQLHASVRQNHHVGRLHVAVDDSPRVDGLEDFSNPREQVDGNERREHLRASAVRERDSRNPLEDHGGNAVNMLEPRRLGARTDGRSKRAGALHARAATSSRTARSRRRTES